MRLTERQLRKVIRQVLKESQETSPVLLESQGGMDEILGDIINWIMEPGASKKFKKVLNKKYPEIVIKIRSV